MGLEEDMAALREEAKKDCIRRGHYSLDGPWAIHGKNGSYICLHCGQDYLKEVTPEEEADFWKGLEDIPLGACVGLG